MTSQELARKLQQRHTLAAINAQVCLWRTTALAGPMAYFSEIVETSIVR